MVTNSRDECAKAEEDDGKIEFLVVYNDGNVENCAMLINLKVFDVPVGCPCEFYLSMA